MPWNIPKISGAQFNRLLEGISLELVDFLLGSTELSLICDSIYNLKFPFFLII